MPYLTNTECANTCKYWQENGFPDKEPKTSAEYLYDDDEYYLGEIATPLSASLYPGPTQLELNPVLTSTSLLSPSVACRDTCKYWMNVGFRQVDSLPKTVRNEKFESTEYYVRKLPSILALEVPKPLKSSHIFEFSSSIQRLTYRNVFFFSAGDAAGCGKTCQYWVKNGF